MAIYEISICDTLAYDTAVALQSLMLCVMRYIHMYDAKEATQSPIPARTMGLALHCAQQQHCGCKLYSLPAHDVITAKSTTHSACYHTSHEPLVQIIITLSQTHCKPLHRTQRSDEDT
eukprot:2622-Heterococcus_DN1.PRE.2